MIEFKCMKKSVSIRHKFIYCYTAHIVYGFEKSQPQKSEQAENVKWRKIKRINEIKTNFKIEQACVQIK